MAGRPPISDEPLTDHGRYGSGYALRDDDIESHRTRSIFTGIQPDQFRHRRTRKASATKRPEGGLSRSATTTEEPGASVAPPQERVQFLLGGTELKDAEVIKSSSYQLNVAGNGTDATNGTNGDKENYPHDDLPSAVAPVVQHHDVFCEMAELSLDVLGEPMWKECARWVKFEEVVEAGGERWSKPHVATLSLHTLLELRCCFVNPTTVIMLDTDVQSLEQLADMLGEKHIAASGSPTIELTTKDHVRDTLMARKVHLFSMRRAHAKDSAFVRSLAEIGHKLSSSTRDMSAHHESSSHRVVESSTDVLSGPRKCDSAANIAAGHRNAQPTHAQSTSVMGRRSSAHGSRDSLQDRDTPTGTSNAGLGSRKASYAGSSYMLDDEAHSAVKFDTHFMKKIPPGAETANILVGEVDWIDSPITAFVRLSHARLFGDLTEVPLATRFVFLMLAPRTPPGGVSKYYEIGRSIATLMSDEVFHEVAYKARNRDDLLAGIDEFLSNVTVLPPGEWDPTIRIEPPQSVPSQQPRKEGAVLVLQAQTQSGGDGAAAKANGDADQPVAHELDSALLSTGKFFGGFVKDVKRKLPFYRSDFADALHVQSIAAFVFLYCACLAPTITFGGMLNKYLDGYMATMESILSAALCGVVFSLLAGQPLTILGSTGPVLVFEKIVYTLSKSMDFDFMSGRLWIGIWCTVMLLAIVAFDLSSLIRFITRFTEESFSCLIALIFIAESFKQLNEVRKEYPVVGNPYDMYMQYSKSPPECACIENFNPNVFVNQTAVNYTLMDELLNNASAYSSMEVYAIQLKVWRSVVPLSLLPLVNATVNMTGLNYTAEQHVRVIAADQCVADKQRVLFGNDCQDPDYVPDVFFFSVLLYFGTFVLSYSLKNLKTSRFFGARAREMISDFSVVIAIIVMSLVDLLVGLETPKLEVPENFQPTRPGRGWLISPFTDRTPVWVIFAAILPALLATILIFMDQQITAVIINRKENKMRKGVGYHLDLLVLAVLILVCSFLGLPWFVASTVPSINHVMALRKETKCTAPGEQPKYLGCRENRVTGLAIAIMTALSVFLGFLLKHIPMPVLFGVFLYMGISCLNGIELVSRFFIMFMPAKNQPDYLYLRNVRLPRVHLFTVIQLLSIAAMWAVKEISVTSIAFPLLVLAMCFIRKALDYVFEQKELFYLDDIIPEAHKREQEDEDIKRKSMAQEQQNAAMGDLVGKTGHLEVPLDNGRVISIAVDSVKYDKDTQKFNLSEQVRRTSIWRSLVSDSQLHLNSNSSTANLGEASGKKVSASSGPMRSNNSSDNLLSVHTSEKKRANADDDPAGMMRRRTVDRIGTVMRQTSNASAAQPLLSKKNKEISGSLEMPEIVVQASTPEMPAKNYRA